MWPAYISAPMAGFVTLFFVGLTTLVCLPMMALVADRVNRRNMLIVVTLVAAVTAYPLLAWLAAAPSVFKFVTFELWFSFMYAAYSAALVGHNHRTRAGASPHRGHVVRASRGGRRVRWVHAGDPDLAGPQLQ